MPCGIEEEGAKGLRLKSMLFIVGQSSIQLALSDPHKTKRGQIAHVSLSEPTRTLAHLFHLDESLYIECAQDLPRPGSRS